MPRFRGSRLTCILQCAEFRQIVGSIWKDYVCSAHRCYSSSDAAGARADCEKYHASQKLRIALANAPPEVFHEVVKHGVVSPAKNPIRTGGVMFTQNVGDLVKQDLFTNMVKAIIPFIATFNNETAFREAVKAYFHENVFSIPECDNSLPVLIDRLGPLITESMTKLELFRDVLGAYYNSKHVYRPLYRSIPHRCKGLQCLELAIALDGKKTYDIPEDFTDILLNFHAQNMAVCIKHLPKLKFIKYDFAFHGSKADNYVEPKEMLPAKEEDWEGGEEPEWRYWKFWDVTEIMRGQAKRISSVREKVDRMRLDCKVRYHGPPHWWERA